MLKLEEVGLTFLVLTRGYWNKGADLGTLKRQAARNAKWEKGDTRKYLLFLVHQDTVIDDEGQFVFPSEPAAEAAIFLGEF